MVIEAALPDRVDIQASRPERQRRERYFPAICGLVSVEQLSPIVSRSLRERHDPEQLRQLFYNKSFTALPVGA
jgi:hypothetical protein